MYPAPKLPKPEDGRSPELKVYMYYCWVYCKLFLTNQEHLKKIREYEKLFKKCYGKEKYKCEICNIEMRQASKYTHNKSKKHLSNMNK